MRSENHKKVAAINVFSLGYQAGWTPESVRNEALRLGAIVVDCRLKPVSRDSEWRGPHPEKVLGDLYVHAEGFGNAKYKEDAIELQNPEPWYDFCEHSIAMGVPVILMCGCWNAKVCHRTVVAKELVERTGLRIWRLFAPRKQQKKMNREGVVGLFEAV